MHSSNEKAVLIQLLDIYVNPSHCLCGNYTSELNGIASLLGNSNFFNGGFYLPDTQDRRTKGASPVLLSLKLQQPTHHSNLVALPLIVLGLLRYISL